MASKGLASIQPSDLLHKSAPSTQVKLTRVRLVCQGGIDAPQSNQEAI